MLRAENLTMLALLNAWSEETGQKVEGLSPGDWFWNRYIPNLSFVLDRIAERDPQKADAIQRIILSMSPPSE